MLGTDCLCSDPLLLYVDELAQIGVDFLAEFDADASEFIDDGVVVVRALSHE